MMEPCSPEDGCTPACPPMGSAESICWSALLACTAFTLPVKLSVSQCMSFLTFALLILSLPGGSEQAAVRGRAAHWS